MSDTSPSKKSGLTRRIVLIGGGALGGGLVIGAGVGALALRPWSPLDGQRELLAKPGAFPLLGSVRIAGDDSVTVFYPHADMGVGNGTALAQMLIEELGADWGQVSIVRSPAETPFANGPVIQGFVAGEGGVPGLLKGPARFTFRKLAENMHMQITGGSSAIRMTGTMVMRQAGAAARDMLIRAAAKDWGVPAREVELTGGRLRHAASNREAGFGAYAEAASALMPLAEPHLKDRKTYTLSGRSVPRFDIPAKVDGSAVYSGDIRLPGMVFAAVQVCPVFGGTLRSVDPAPAKARRGIVDVIALPDAVAVTADSYWRALTAVRALDPQWNEGANARLSSTETLNQMDAALTGKDLKKDYAKGSPQAIVDGDGKRLTATYQVPYLAHAPMEPVGCAVDFSDGTLTIYGAFQDALRAKFLAADIAGLAADKVKIVHTEMGGSFGRKGMVDNYLTHAVLTAKAAGRPVNFLYSREDDMTQDYYRNASVAHFSASLDEGGKPAAVIYRYAEKADPKEASHFPYDIAHIDARYAKGINKVPWGFWRSVDQSIHSFFTESFIDELAHAAGADPWRYRQQLLEHDPRARTVLDNAAKLASWGGQTLPPRTGIGIALAKSFGTWVAESAKVEVTPDGDIRVHNIWVAADPGEIINPEAFKRQMESGVVYGLTAALYGEITVDKGRVEQQNFPDYPMVQMADCPAIETHILTSGDPAGGAGEPSTPLVAPAVANAIFAATGIRPRSLPLSKLDLRAGAPAS